MTEERRRRAAQALRVPSLSVGRGLWWPERPVGEADFGLIVVDGFLLRDVRLGPAVSAEMIGPGDLLRPWSDGAFESLVKPSCAWRAIAPSRLAVLGERVSRVAAHFPELAVALSDRLLRRERCLQYLAAVGHFPRVDDRVLMVLWHLASMWGRVTPRGVVVPIKLTQDHLARIVGAQRPTVSLALSSLRAAGRLDRIGRFHLLLGDPPIWDFAAGPTSSPTSQLESATR